MLRVCGADGEQKPSAQERCWCKGVFCGKGGAKLSVAFRRAFRKASTAASREQFQDLIAQADLFDGDETRELWERRFNNIVPFEGRARRRA